MKFTRFLSLERPSQVANTYWGNLQRLVVLIGTCDDSTTDVTAYGIDPDHVDPDADTAAFELIVPATKVGTFFKLLADGQAFQAGDEEGAVTDSVDVTPVSPPTQGPKLRQALIYTAVLRIGEKFVQLEPLEISSSPPAEDQPSL